jgi:hypothetical protein
MNHEIPAGAFIAFPIAGLLSALLPVCFNLHRLVGDSAAYVLIGGAFGACNAACLYWFFGMRSLWRMVAFMVGCVAACYTSLLAAAGAFWVFRSPAFSMHESMAYFVGGFTGAVIVLLAALLLFSPAMNFFSLLLLVCGALVGGVLGVVGRAAGPLFYAIRMHLPSMKFYGGDSDVSMVVLWQAGTACLLSLLMWIELRSARKLAQHGSFVGRG